jgi:hypothetical protein
MTGSFPARKLTRYSVVDDQIVECMYEDDGHGNQTTQFLAQLVELKRDYPLTLGDVKITEPARPKVVKTEDRTVITIRPASVADDPKALAEALIGPIDTEFDAQVLASILSEHTHRGWSDWEAVSTHTEVTETIL